MGKYAKEKEDALTSLRAARKEAENERVAKDRCKEDLARLMAERQGTGASSALSYSELEKKVKDLESEVFVLGT